MGGAGTEWKKDFTICMEVKTMKKALFTMALVAIMCTMVISGCNSPETTAVDPALTGGGNGCCDPAPLTLNGGIMGLVVSVRNEPIAGAAVTLLYPGGNSWTTTDASGQYLFQDVPVAGLLNHDDQQTWDFGSGVPYSITVAPPEDDLMGYVTVFTAALLDFATLYDMNLLSSGDGVEAPRVIGDLQVSAIPATLERTVMPVCQRFRDSIQQGIK